MRNASLLIAAFALAACTSPNLSPLLGTNPDNPTVEMVTQGYSNRTVLTVDRQHGTQVRYFADNGRTFLWYPGNNRIVAADWRVQSQDRDGFALCFKHGTQTFAPVSGSSGRVWKCSGSVAQALAMTDEIVAGDPFNLSNGAVPFVMPYATDLTMEDLAQSADLNPDRLNYVYQWRRL